MSACRSCGVLIEVRPVNVYEWIAYGVEKGWVTEACATHDGIPSTPEEGADWERGHDPCQHVLRLWPDGQPPGGQILGEAIDGTTDPDGT